MASAVAAGAGRGTQLGRSAELAAAILVSGIARRIGQIGSGRLGRALVNPRAPAPSPGPDVQPDQDLLSAANASVARVISLPAFPDGHAHQAAARDPSRAGHRQAPRRAVPQARAGGRRRQGGGARGAPAAVPPAAAGGRAAAGPALPRPPVRSPSTAQRGWLLARSRGCALPARPLLPPSTGLPFGSPARPGALPGPLAACIPPERSLDTITSGALVLARDRETAGLLARAFRLRAVSKYYGGCKGRRGGEPSALHSPCGPADGLGGQGGAGAEV